MVTLTRLDQDQRYAAGMRKAEELLGEACRPFDRACWGICQVFSASWDGTYNAFAKDVINRWHNPLASATKDCTLTRWRQAFPEVAQYYTREDHGPREMHRLLTGVGLPSAAEVSNGCPTAFSIQRAAEAETERQTRIKLPWARKNSKKFLAAQQELLPQVIQEATQQQWRMYQQKVNRYCCWSIGEVGDWFDKSLDYLRDMFATASDLQMLNAHCVVAASILARHENLITRIKTIKEGLNKGEEQLKWTLSRMPMELQALERL